MILLIRSASEHTKRELTFPSSFGYNSKQTALLSIPSGAISIVSIITATAVAGRYNNRSLCIVLLLLLGMLGAALMAFLPKNQKAGKLIGNYLTNCIGASLPLLYSWVAANFAGHTKKVVMNVVLLMSFCLGNIIGPETFKNGDAPDYIPAKITILVTCALAIILAVILRIMYQLENKRRNRSSVGVEHTVNQEFLDLTDKGNREFRVSLVGFFFSISLCRRADTSGASTNSESHVMV